MRLEGSCHCGAVSFRLESPHPYPYNYCYCSICCKTAGGGGYAVNLGGDYDTLEVDGRDRVRVYRVKHDNGELSTLERHFCGDCGAMLWAWSSRWPELVHPFASAIDSDLPTAPERTHLMLGSKAGWVAPCIERGDKSFDEYPDESIAQWHERLGLAGE